MGCFPEGGRHQLRVQVQHQTGLVEAGVKRSSVGAPLGRGQVGEDLTPAGQDGHQPPEVDHGPAEPVVKEVARIVEGIELEW